MSEAMTVNTQPTVPAIALKSEASRLTGGLGVEGRVELAQRITNNYNTKNFDEFERKLAEKIFAILASDAEVQVRKTLAENLKNNPEIPHVVAVRLANDVIEVAQPILTHSRVLRDNDLVEIVRTSKSLAHKMAITLRAAISADVGSALVQSKEIEVIRGLMANKGAELTEEIVMHVLESCAGENTILELLVKRSDIPLSAIDKMMSKISNELRVELIKTYKVSPHVAQTVVQASRESATLGLMSLRSPDVDVSEVVEQMHRAGSLNHSLIIRALCVGDLAFFEAALAKMAGIPLQSAKILMHDRGSLGFKALYKSANMPVSMFEAVKVVLALGLEETCEQEYANDNYQGRVLERIIDGGYDTNVDNMSYMMGILSSNMMQSRSMAVH